jgi:hypothetical protein
MKTVHKKSPQSRAQTSFLAVSCVVIFDLVLISSLKQRKTGKIYLSAFITVRVSLQVTRNVNLSCFSLFQGSYKQRVFIGAAPTSRLKMTGCFFIAPIKVPQGPHQPHPPLRSLRPPGTGGGGPSTQTSRRDERWSVNP